MTSTLQVLLDRNVPHVLEKIFVDHLDYDDFLSCLDVSRALRRALARGLLGAGSGSRAKLVLKRRRHLWRTGRLVASALPLQSQDSSHVVWGPVKVMGSSSLRKEEYPEEEDVVVLARDRRARIKLFRIVERTPCAAEVICESEVVHPKRVASCCASHSHVVVFLTPDNVALESHGSHQPAVEAWFFERCSLTLTGKISSDRLRGLRRAHRLADGSFAALSEAGEPEVKRLLPGKVESLMPVRVDHACSRFMRHCVFGPRHLIIACKHRKVQVFDLEKKAEVLLCPKGGRGFLPPNRGSGDQQQQQQILSVGPIGQVAIAGDLVCVTFKYPDAYEVGTIAWVFRLDSGEEVMRTTITSRYPPRVALSTDFVVFGYYKYVLEKSSFINLEVHDLRSLPVPSSSPVCLRANVGSVFHSEMSIAAGGALLLSFRKRRKGDDAPKDGEEEEEEEPLSSRDEGDEEGIMVVDLERGVKGYLERRRKRRPSRPLSLSSEDGEEDADKDLRSNRKRRPLRRGDSVASGHWPVVPGGAVALRDWGSTAEAWVAIAGGAAFAVAGDSRASEWKEDEDGDDISENEVLRVFRGRVRLDAPSLAAVFPKDPVDIDDLPEGPILHLTRETEEDGGKQNVVKEKKKRRM